VKLDVLYTSARDEFQALADTDTCTFLWEVCGQQNRSVASLCSLKHLKKSRHQKFFIEVELNINLSSILSPFNIEYSGKKLSRDLTECSFI
jgi:hypothetical protein